MTAVRTLLVDDNARFLSAARRLLESWREIEVVGCVESGADAVRAVGSLRPELVLMDLVMPGMNGLEATMAIKRQADPPRVVIVTLEDSSEHRVRALAAGADAVVGKTGFASEVLSLITRMFA